MLNPRSIALIPAMVAGISDRLWTLEEIGGENFVANRAGSMTLPRNQAEAHRVANERYPFKCCAVCGLQIATCLTIAHLDHNAGNNAPETLARLCQTHHWMYDAGLYPKEAIMLLQAHWQTVKGVADHRVRMKDAGAKAALTRKRRAAGRKAAETRKLKPS